MSDSILSGVRRPASGVRRPASGVRRPAPTAIAAVLLTATVATADRPRTPYEVIDLGRSGFIHDPNGSAIGEVAGTFEINSREQVAYAREVMIAGSPVIRPYLFSLRDDYDIPGGVPTDMLTAFGPSGVTSGAAFDINDDGVVAGQIGGSGLFEGTAHVWILDHDVAGDAILVEIDPPGERTWSRAVSISETVSGQPWTVVVQTGQQVECPVGCKAMVSIEAEMVQSFAITVSATGALGPVTWLTDDGDCEQTIGAWAVSAAGDGFVGSDITLDNSLCVISGNDGCGTDESGLRWNGSGSVLMLSDFDGGGSDVQPSEGRGLGTDGIAAGYGFEEVLAGVCRERALLWDASGAIEADLYQAGTDPVIDAGVVGLDATSRTVAEGVNDAVRRLVAGWDELFARSAIWYQADVPSDPGDPSSPLITVWRVLFPGAVPFLSSTDSVVAGSCLETSGASPSDVVIRFLYDINDDGAALGRADVAGNAESDTEELHLVLLLPRPDGCTGMGDVSGDTDRDGDVDFDDLLQVLSQWNVNCTNCAWCPADLNGDRLVDFDDLLIVLATFSVDCITFDGPPQSVQDCWDRYGSDITAFEACVQSLSSP